MFVYFVWVRVKTYKTETGLGSPALAVEWGALWSGQSKNLHDGRSPGTGLGSPVQAVEWGVLCSGQSESLQDGRSPGTGLGSPVQAVEGGVLCSGQSESLQDGRSPGTGLGSPAQAVEWGVLCSSQSESLQDGRSPLAARCNPGVFVSLRPTCRAAPCPGCARGQRQPGGADLGGGQAAGLHRWHRRSMLGNPHGLQRVDLLPPQEEEGAQPLHRLLRLHPCRYSTNQKTSYTPADTAQTKKHPTPLQIQHPPKTTVHPCRYSTHQKTPYTPAGTAPTKNHCTPLQVQHPPKNILHPCRYSTHQKTSYTLAGTAPTKNHCTPLQLHHRNLNKGICTKPLTNTPACTFQKPPNTHAFTLKNHSTRSHAGHPITTLYITYLIYKHPLSPTLHDI